jgi:hypothetical protein
MIKLKVKHYNGKAQYTVEAEPSWYLDDLRDKLVEEEQDCSLDLLQRLSFKGQVLDDAETLEDMKIVDGATIAIEKVSVTVALPSPPTTTKKSKKAAVGAPTTFRIKLAPDDQHPAKKIKRAALKRGELGNFDSPASLVCFFDGRELTDGTSMADAHLGHECTVLIDFYALQVTFKADVWTVQVNPTETIYAIKKDVESMVSK